MNKYKIKFDNGYEFYIKDFHIDNSSRIGVVGINGIVASEKSINFSSELTKENIIDLPGSINPDNMKHFILYENGEELMEFTGYSDIQNAGVDITPHSKILSVRANMQSEG